MKYSKPVGVLITAVVSVCIFTALYFIAVFSGGLIQVKPVSAENGGSAEAVTVYLDNNGRHYDLWIPAEYCSFLTASAGNASAFEGWYGFGWGDRDFFLNTPYADDVKAGILLKALFIPSRSVLAVQHSNLPPSGRSVSGILISEAGAEAAAEYIAGWFIDAGADCGGTGMRTVPDTLVHPSYDGYSFYESNRSYSIFFTSNNWVSGALKASGTQSGLWTPLTFGVAPRKD